MIVSRLQESIKTVFIKLIGFEKELINDPEFKNKTENKYVGPNAINLKDLENEILEVLPYYTQFIDRSELEAIVESSNRLQIDKISIYIYEEREDFEKCMKIYLTSPG